MYPLAQREEVTRLLVEQCGHNIPGCGHYEDEVAFERLRFAALKVSHGDMEALKKAIDLAKLDYRDLLCAAGFAWSPTKHERWLPKGIGTRQESWWTRLLKGTLGR
jgi:hypothetical protein